MIFSILFGVGLLLATAGGIVGLIDAFRVSPVWGLLSLFIPFVLLIFWIKFWHRKWARNSLLISLAGLGSMLLAIPFGGSFVRQRLANLDNSVEELPVENIPLEQIPIATGTEEEFVEPLVPAAPQLVSIARADLIQSTDPDERLQQINSRRPDPFAVVPVPPKPKAAPPPAPLTGTASPGAGGTAPGGAATGGAPVTTAPPAGQETTEGQSPLKPLPVLPQPTLAQGVMVTGVVDIGGENFAIVQSPDESSSRYVKVGQRIANGQVLVKRINVGGGDPVVVLEQNGIEVSRSVGSPPAGMEEAPENTAVRLSAGGSPG
ncbi:MAG: hypothetical protein ACFCVD_15650 [Nodosilinea sp.]